MLLRDVGFFNAQYVLVNIFKSTYNIKINVMFYLLFLVTARVIPKFEINLLVFKSEMLDV